MITSTELDLLKSISFSLGVNYNDLYKLIDFESGWNPQAKNPFSTAKGLIQFTNSTAKDLGFVDSSDLIKKNQSIVDQLQIVYKYLSRYKPFKNKQSLYMAVYYPAAMNWDRFKQFPDSTYLGNYNIKTPQNYIDLVDKNITKKSNIFILIAGAILFYILTKGKKNVRETTRRTTA